jgi:UPF0271 protein
MRATVRLAIELGVAIGAHPGFADRAGFGRREMNLPWNEVIELVTSQIAALQTIAKSEGAKLCHVKPHGALYNMAARDEQLAASIAKSVAQFDQRLVLYAPSGSQLFLAGREYGLRTAGEVFADRTYEIDGSLTSRDIPGAVISDPNESIRQAIEMICSGHVRTRQGSTIPVQADTLCVHGDNPNAVAIVRRLRTALEANGIAIRRICNE